MLKQSDVEFSAICVQESWIAEGEDISQIKCRVIIVYHRDCHVLLRLV